MSKENCIDHIETAIELLHELRAIIDSADEDAPQAFLEAAQDAQDQIGKAIYSAIAPVLQGQQQRLID